ncbi:DedA family protein [Helicobacter pametensis]|uniref:DedA family protein n=1 Tax=Helicobacter pametensis TaxID=95149 RepID=UPI00048796DB|nr:DedA family protein [Helicobacter pametensis]
MQEMISNLETYGYIFLFFYSFGGGFVGIVAAGVISALGKMDLTLSIVIASLGNIAGSTLLVYLGRYQKKDFQKYLQKHRRKVALVHIWLKRYGILLIFVNKYIYGFKTLLPLVVGVSKYPFVKFSIWNTLASVIWGVAMGFGGFFASNLAIRIFERIKDYPYVMPLGFACIVGLILIVMKFKAKNRKS